MKKNIVNELKWYSKQTINTTFQSIAQILLDLKPESKIPGITDISKAAFTTPSSVTRFCSQLGYDGYKELINRLYHELEFLKEDLFSKVKKTNWNNDFIFDNNYEKIIKTLSSINEVTYNNIVSLAQRTIMSKIVFVLYSKTNHQYAHYLYECLINLKIQVYLIDNNKIIQNYNLDENNTFIVGMIFDEDWFWFEELISELTNTKYCLITDEENFKGTKNEINIESKDADVINFVNSKIYIYYVLNQIIRQIANRIK